MLETSIQVAYEFHKLRLLNLWTVTNRSLYVIHLQISSKLVNYNAATQFFFF